MARFLVHWIVVGIAVAVVARLLPSLRADDMGVLVTGGLFVGFANAIVGGFVKRADVRLHPVPLGLALIAVNVIGFGVAAATTPDFPVGALWQVVIGALLVSVISWPFALTRYEPEPEPT